MGRFLIDILSELRIRNTKYTKITKLNEGLALQNPSTQEPCFSFHTTVARFRNGGIEGVDENDQQGMDLAKFRRTLTEVTGRRFCHASAAQFPLDHASGFLLPFGRNCRDRPWPVDGR